MNAFLLSNQYGEIQHTCNVLIFENKRTHAYVTLEGTEEFILYIGKEQTKELSASDMQFVQCVQTDEGATLTYTKAGITVDVRYFVKERTFEKRLYIRSDAPIFIKRIALETRIASTEVTRGGEGQPVFLGNSMWCGIEYPVANNYYEEKALYFTQSPYEEGTAFESLPVVYGMDDSGCILTSFENYVKSKMLPKEKTRIYCDWGLHDDIDSKVLLTEKLTLDNIERLDILSKRSGVRFDYYLMDAYWFKEGAPYNEFKEETFPEGSKNVVASLEKHGMKYGLWFDINCINAHLKGMEKYATLLSSGALCFACDEIAQLMTNAILKQVRESGIKMIKLDFAYFECENAEHNHSVDFTEAKEHSVKNFIHMLEVIRKEQPDFKVLCYNGWTTELRWITSVEKRYGYAVSPYWCEYIDYIYCGDPRPSEIACENLADSVSYYTDSMVATFRDSAMPFEAIDDHGTMMGETCTIYYMDKALYRRGALMNVMRGAKVNLYGMLDLNEADAAYFRFVDKVYDDLYDKKMRVSAIVGDPRKGEAFGYSLCGKNEGYFVVANPAQKKTYANVSLPVWQGKTVACTRCIVNGELVEESAVESGDTCVVELSENGYALFAWKLLPQKTEKSVIFSTGDSLMLEGKGKALRLNFTKDGKPIRTPYGYPEGFGVLADGKQLPLTIKNYVWSGISWGYLHLHGEKEICLTYTGKGSVRVKYTFEEE